MAECARKQLILGTAGHVDHGKTMLIKAMTGINTDRLKEEQERGLTIDLGFAHMLLPSGAQIGIIDVPGHERFLKNMLAGAGGIDVALLVVAADEGVMPQTREHLEILEMLETRRGIVALTKTDMVEADWLDLVEEDVRSALKGTFLDGARIIRVSGVTCEGVPELIAEIDRVAAEIEQRPVDAPFRMTVDRVFTITGFGTVVTGSLLSGTLRVGDPIEVLPQKLETRARQIEVHEQRQQVAYAGTRVAVNLAGLDVDDLHRGSMLVSPGLMSPTRTMDVLVTMLQDSPQPIRNRTRVRMHIGAAEVIGRVQVLGAEEIAPGQKGFAQLRLESDVAAARGDRFVLRLYSPTYLLGGGIVVVANAPRHKRKDESVVARLERALRGEPVDIVEDALGLAPAGAVPSEIVQETRLPETAVRQALAALKSAQRIVEKDGRYAALSAFAAASARTRAILEDYHKAHPTRPGMPREELRAQLGPRIDQKGFAFLVGLMADAGEIVASEAAVRLASHSRAMTPDQQKLADAVEERYRSAGANPPLTSEIERSHGQSVRDIIAVLLDQGKLIRIDDQLLFHADAIQRAEAALRRYLAEHGQIAVHEFRDVIGSSRKYTVPLLEYFDHNKVTQRVGDLRRLRER